MPDRKLRPRSGSSAKSVLLTVLGELALPHDGAMWTATIVDALGLLGVGEGNARQAATRLKDQGLLDVERHGRRARWGLTEEGRHLLSVGTQRIYRFAAGADEWNGSWVVVLTAVPEDQRSKRHQLRSTLAFAGFGFIGPGTAVSPHPDREGLAIELLRELGLTDSAIVLRARAGDLVDDEEILRRAWDLDDLAARYRSFLATFEQRRPQSPNARFAALVELVHTWRRFPFDDPELPDRLLPPTWPGRRAKQLFDELHEAWSPDAHRWYERTENAAYERTENAAGL
jgi:phenylacetic acid degradation operon negative regulatory protein